MKRYKIEICKTGVSVFDRQNNIYIIDASTIQIDNSFTISKKVRQSKNYKWETKYFFNATKLKEK